MWNALLGGGLKVTDKCMVWGEDRGNEAGVVVLTHGQDGRL
jgi:hypothetical protein